MQSENLVIIPMAESFLPALAHERWKRKIRECG
jgi:hypothetical protein